MAREQKSVITPVNVAAIEAGVVIPTTPLTNKGAFETNQKNVAAAGTGEQFQTQAIPDGFSVNIKAKRGNTGSIWLGDSQANSQNHSVAYELRPGEQIAMFITNTNLCWIDADVNGEGVNWIVETA